MSKVFEKGLVIPGAKLLLLWGASLKAGRPGHGGCWDKENVKYVWEQVVMYTGRGTVSPMD